MKVEEGGVMSQECRCPLEAKESNGFCPRCSRRNQSSWHLDFKTSDLQNCTRISPSEATTSVVICYSIHRELIHQVTRRGDSRDDGTALN